MESEDLRFEIIKMKETRHNNLIQFIGACLDFPNVCVLTEVAPKVSDYVCMYLSTPNSIN